MESAESAGCADDGVGSDGSNSLLDAEGQSNEETEEQQRGRFLAGELDRVGHGFVTFLDLLVLLFLESRACGPPPPREP